jgi:hypothetical protein
LARLIRRYLLLVPFNVWLQEAVEALLLFKHPILTIIRTKDREALQSGSGREYPFAVQPPQHLEANSFKHSLLLVVLDPGQWLPILLPSRIELLLFGSWTVAALPEQVNTARAALVG